MFALLAVGSFGEGLSQRGGVPHLPPERSLSQHVPLQGVVECERVVVCLFVMRVVVLTSCEESHSRRVVVPL